MIMSLDFFIKKFMFFFFEGSFYSYIFSTPKFMSIFSSVFKGSFFVVCLYILVLSLYKSSYLSSSMLNFENFDFERWVKLLVELINWFILEILESICLWLSFREGKKCEYFIISSKRISNLELLLYRGMLAGSHGIKLVFLALKGFLLIIR